MPFPPPLLFGGGLLLAVLLQRVAPLPPLLHAGIVSVTLGIASVVGGLALMSAGILTFRRFRTAVYPNRPAKLVVDAGIYAYTRNPMYLGLAILYAGVSLLMTSWWAVVLLPIVLLLVRTQVIRREERHLRERFPDAYADYCRRVRRWI